MWTLINPALASCTAIVGSAVGTMVSIMNKSREKTDMNMLEARWILGCGCAGILICITLTQVVYHLNVSPPPGRETLFLQINIAQALVHIFCAGSLAVILPEAAIFSSPLRCLGLSAGVLFFCVGVNLVDEWLQLDGASIASEAMEGRDDEDLYISLATGDCHEPASLVPQKTASQRWAKAKMAFKVKSELTPQQESKGSSLWGRVRHGTDGVTPRGRAMIQAVTTARNLVHRDISIRQPRRVSGAHTRHHDRTLDDHQFGV